jgi:hypothetical protein
MEKNDISAKKKWKKIATVRDNFKNQTFTLYRTKLYLLELHEPVQIKSTALF